MVEPLTCWQSCFCPSEYLDVWNVDVLKQPQELNKQEHHTHLYSSDFLIVRRAQEFQIKITFNRPYKPAEDKFALEFVIGESPRIQLNIWIVAFLNGGTQNYIFNCFKMAVLSLIDNV